MLGNMENILIDLTTSVIEKFILIFMMSVFLDFTPKFKRNLITYFSIYIVLNILKVAIFPKSFLFVFVISVYGLLFVFITFKGNLLHKAFAFCITVCLNYAIDIFTISFTNMGFNYNLFFTTITGGISGIWFTLIKVALVALAYILVKSLASDTTFKIGILSKQQTAILIILPAFSFATMSILDWGVRNYVNVPINVSTFLLIASFCTIVYNVVIMILIDKLILNKKYKQLNQMSEAQLLTQFNHYEQITRKNQETRKLKHDMKNHLSCIRNLIENNEIAAAKELLNEIEDTIHGLDLEISTGNNIADAILNEKHRVASKSGIKFEYSGVLPQHNFITPFDISTIFSNALDNALEAAEKSSEPDKYIKIATFIHGKCLFISIENSVGKNIKVAGKEIDSTKENKGQHGFGLKNINDSVEKYGGSLSLTCENNVFKLEILLNINI